MSDRLPTSSDAADSDDVAAFDQIARRCAEIRQQLRRVIVGQDAIVQLLLTAIFSHGHVLIVGVPGLAKTLLVRTLADALGLPFRRIQFTPDMMPSDILGTELIQEDATTGQRSMKFVPGPVFAQLILADEINRTPPKTQAALLEAMGERQVTVAGHTRKLDQPFVVVATQNPIEQEGTYPLPEAQLDRFMFSLWMDYPTREEEIAIVTDTHRIMHEKVSQAFDGDTLRRSIELVWQMPVSQHVVDYAVTLARATRPREADSPEIVKRYVEWGAGPRASQYLIHGSRALAAIEGEPTPSCDHVRRVATAVLRHRIVVNYAATGDNIAARDIVQKLVEVVREG
ncbi:MAG: MoxR family ATPase [Phycisphaeraceae bacterium]